MFHFIVQTSHVNWYQWGAIIRLHLSLETQCRSVFPSTVCKAQHFQALISPKTKLEIESSLRALKTTLFVAVVRDAIPALYVATSVLFGRWPAVGLYLAPVANLVLREVLRNVGILLVSIANFEKIRTAFRLAYLIALAYLVTPTM